MADKKVSDKKKKEELMKMEIAAELGLADKIQKYGWKSLTSRESGKIGGVMRSKKSRG